MLLKTERLLLREFKEGDFDDFSSLMANPEVMRFSVNGPLSKEQATDTFQKRILEHYKKYGFGLFAVFLQESQEFIGFVGLISQTIDNQEEIELAYRLYPQYWNKGFATEAAAALCDYAFHQLNITRLISIIDPQNKRSLKVASKIGMCLWKKSNFHNSQALIYSLENPAPHTIEIVSERLFIRTVKESDAERLASLEAKNQKHWSPYASIASQNSTSTDYWVKKTKIFASEQANNQSFRFIIFEKSNLETPIIGMCNFTQIFRGPFHACYLGYKIDYEYEGKGLMHEALKETISYMFNIQNLHRIMANYMPSNERSARLLHKLGFVVEGQAKKYLLINGQWEDHVLTSLTNANWRA